MTNPREKLSKTAIKCLLVTVAVLTPIFIILLNTEISINFKIMAALSDFTVILFEAMSKLDVLPFWIYPTLTVGFWWTHCLLDKMIKGDYTTKQLKATYCINNFFLHFKLHWNSWIYKACNLNKHREYRFHTCILRFSKLGAFLYGLPCQFI